MVKGMNPKVLTSLIHQNELPKKATPATHP
jgi:hypothetical protein